MKLKLLGAVAGAALTLAPVAAHATCEVAANAMNAEPVKSNLWYHDIDATGAVVRQHGVGYFPLSPTGSAMGPSGMVDRDGWVSAIRARMPVYRPMPEGAAAPINGWMYSADRRHGATDFASGGNSFRVDAVADGVVVWVGYMPSPGNVVVIEHTAKDGSKFRSIYHHLRNGRDTDLAKAKLTRTYYEKVVKKSWENPDPKDTDHANWVAYFDQASNDADTLSSNPTQDELAAVERVWGQPSEAILVSQGQPVKAGQQIGMAGLTGVHGYNSRPNNTHLHVAFAAPAQHWDAGVQKTLWTLFDPFGLYALDAACYQAEHPTGAGGAAPQHPTVYAPVFQDFAGLDHAKLSRALVYFAGFGWAPRTLAADTSTAPWTVGGSFQPDTGVSVTRALRTPGQRNADDAAWAGWQLYPRSVLGTTNGTDPRFTTLYGALLGPTAVDHWMTAAKLDTNVDTYAAAGYQLTDVSAYLSGGQLQFTGTWVKNGQGAYVRGLLTAQQLGTVTNEQKALGYRLVALHKYVHPGYGERFLALYHPSSKTVLPYWDLTAEQVRSYRDLFANLYGYRVRHMSALNGKYTVVFEK